VSNTESKVIFMYSGQASQYYHMGADLYHNNTVFRYWMKKLDETAIKCCGSSIVDVIYNGQNKITDKFDKILYTHPAIFMIEYSLTQVLLEMNIIPDFLLGTSLGEYVAVVLAERCHYEAILETVIYEANLIENRCRNGGMLAILTEKDVFYEKPGIFKKCEFASDNYNSHFVVSGDINDLRETEILLEEKCINFQRLPVSVAFHSSNINCIEKEFKNLLRKLTFNESSSFPIISCAYKTINPKITIDYLWDIIRKPVLFKDTIEFINKTDNNIYIDLGPSGTLSGFVNKCLNSNEKSYSIITPFGGNEKRLKIIQELFSRKNLNRMSTKLKETKNTVAYVFPGQGSQKKGMGENLFDEYKELTRKADKVLGYSIKELCLNDPENQLGLTQFTQPALYVVNALYYLKKTDTDKKIPDYVAGHSLGEYNALFASGAFDFETGLKLVKKRGELMSKAQNGGMAAVIGMDEETIRAVLKKEELNNIDIANLNSPSQIVISGRKNEIIEGQSIFEVAGCKMYIPLNVSGAFHSRLMEDARQEFEDFINQFTFSPLKVPVISNVLARPYSNDNIRKLLVDQITNSVKWTESMCYLMGKGVQEFIEVGPGNTLTGMINKIKKEGEPLIIEEEIKSFENKNQLSGEVKEISESSSKAEILTDENVNKITEINKKKSSIEKIKQKIKNVIPTESKKIKPGITEADQLKDYPKVVTAGSLGSKEFKKDYNLKYAYLTGGMYHGVASTEMVVKMGRAGMLGFFGTGGLNFDETDRAIKSIQKELESDISYGINLVHNANSPESEEKMIDIFLDNNVTIIEAAAFMGITPALVKYRLKGLKENSNEVEINNKIIAKISRPEVAEAFLSPAPEAIIGKLLNEGKITAKEAELSKHIPMADDLCVETDSGGHTDQGVAYAVFPAILTLRNTMVNKFKYNKNIRVGAAGGIGTPEAAAAAFILGADFILTGSINQCTLEAGTSDIVKDLLQQINVQDTGYAPAGDMFEFGAKVQVLKKGIFFPVRASKLYDLYRYHNSLDEIDAATKEQIQEKFFKRSFEDVYKDVEAFYPQDVIDRANENPKYKMGLIFRWYFNYSSQLALTGKISEKVNFQVHCGPALGAFNQWVKDSSWEDWRNRHVDEIAIKIMEEATNILINRYNLLFSNHS
jgi:trans-AT polyketide synthase, acyltransferase and oxidoreductase domains